MIALNTAVAEQLTEFKKEVDELIEKGEPKISAIIQVIRKYIKISKPIRFDGNGYSDEWKEEAARRGLDCETSCPVIFDQYLTEDSVRMFESAGVMTRKELEARNEVKWETYTKKIQIEARVLGDLVMNHVVPVAIEYQSKLIDNVYKMKQIFPTEEAEKLSAENMAIIRKIAEHTSYIKEHVGHHGRSPESSQQNCGRAYESHRISRQDSSDAGTNPLPHRQAGTDCRRSDVDTPEISRTVVRSIIPT